MPEIRTVNVWAALSAFIMMSGGILAWANLNATVQDSTRSLARIEVSQEQERKDVREIHDHGIEMDMRLRAIEKKLGMADIEPEKR